MKKITTYITALIIGIASIANFTPALASINCSDPSIPAEVLEAAGCNSTSDKLPTTVVGIINAIISVAGIVAVIFIIIGGINYITSTGDAAKVQKAKNTILYACIGLVICVLSFAIVNFTIGMMNKTPSNYGSESGCKAAGYHWDQDSNKCK